MCRNIKPLFNFTPPATDEEISEASFQFLRKLSGFNKPSKANEEVLNRTVNEMSLIIRNFLDLLVTNSKPRNRKIETQLALDSVVKRFGRKND